jgi:hypothetical protein
MEKDTIEYFIGIGENPQYPGIITGPFKKAPGFDNLIPGHSVWKRINNGEYIFVCIRLA